jgi:HEAT repeat protein
MEDVRAALTPEEVDYAQAQKLGPEAIPFLRELISGQDLNLASKAVYLASLIKSEEAISLLEIATKRNEPILRVAAAAGLRNMDENAVQRVIDILSEDRDVGVRKVTLKSLSAFKGPYLAERVKKLAEGDPEKFIRELASDVLQRMK